jgi:hypothetical protein
MHVYIRMFIWQDFGEEGLKTLFLSIDETPIAAASLAQVCYVCVCVSMCVCVSVGMHICACV